MTDGARLTTREQRRRLIRIGELHGIAQAATLIKDLLRRAQADARRTISVRVRAEALQDADDALAELLDPGVIARQRLERERFARQRQAALDRAAKAKQETRRADAAP